MIKFNKHNVTSGKIKARVWYTAHVHVSTGRNCVTISEKDYGRNLHEIFETVENNTDWQTDYFDNSRVRIFEGDALYETVKAVAEANEAAWEAKRAKRVAA